MAHQALAARELPSGQTTSVIISLKLRNAEQLRALSRNTNNPRNPQYRKYLTRAQFLTDYAPTDAQVQTVVDYLRKNGFINIDVAPNRLLVSAHGTAGAVRTAFNTSLVRYQFAGRSGYANTSKAQVPRALGGIVGSVLGLQNVARAHPLFRVKQPTPVLAHNAKVTTHNPAEFSSIYNATDVSTASKTTVGIITIGGVSQTQSDLKKFAKQNSYAAIATDTIETNGSDGDYHDDSGGQTEWNLDSQSIVGAAGGSVGKLVFYMGDLGAPGNTGLTKAFNRAVSDNNAKIINVSLGWCEADAKTDGTIDAEEQIFTVAVAQGQTFSVASGDEGVYECNNRGYPDGKNYSVAWPASSPHVLSIGGTTLSTKSSGIYESEAVWNEGLDDNGKLWATGGGISSVLPNPAWQTGSKRQLPDVSFDAAQSSGANIYSDGSIVQVGGTSLAAPIFAGLWARILSANGEDIGFPAASLYSAIPNNPSLVNDVVSGNNGYEDNGYEAKTGWDYSTGWGSLNISALNKLIQSGGFQ